MDLDNLRLDVFQEESYDDGEGKTITLYTAVVKATSLKRNVRVVIVDCMEPGKKTQTRKTFFSTDTEMSAKDIMDIYRTRFQIEFLLRDSKQYTGLTHCKSRHKETLAFHFNSTSRQEESLGSYCQDADSQCNDDPQIFGAVWQTAEQTIKYQRFQRTLILWRR